MAPSSHDQIGYELLLSASNAGSNSRRERQQRDFQHRRSFPALTGARAFN